MLRCCLVSCKLQSLAVDGYLFADGPPELWLAVNDYFPLHR